MCMSAVCPLCFLCVALPPHRNAYPQWELEDPSPARQLLPYTLSTYSRVQTLWPAEVCFSKDPPSSCPPWGFFMVYNVYHQVSWLGHPQNPRRKSTPSGRPPSASSVLAQRGRLVEVNCSGEARKLHRIFPVLFSPNCLCFITWSRHDDCFRVMVLGGLTGQSPCHVISVVS